MRTNHFHHAWNRLEDLGDELTSEAETAKHASLWLNAEARRSGVAVRLTFGAPEITDDGDTIRQRQTVKVVIDGDPAAVHTLRLAVNAALEGVRLASRAAEVHASRASLYTAGEHTQDTATTPKGATPK